MTTTNPLQQFFRRAKFSILLPSRGKWYPKSALKHNQGQIEIFAMTAADEARMRAAEFLINGSAVFDLIRSCAPEIMQPEQMPQVDLEAVMLSIRRATFGNTVSVTGPVPNTNLTHTVQLDIDHLVDQLPNADLHWDETLNIIHPDQQTVKITVKPLSLKNMFAATKQIIKQQQSTADIAQNNQPNDQKIDQLDEQMKSLAQISIGMIVDSISKISVGDFSTENPAEIKNFINNIDWQYFQAIQQHIEAQKTAIAFSSVTVKSSESMIQAGAPAEWTMPVQFDLTNFFEL
jgi:hypothetical protein